MTIEKDWLWVLVAKRFVWQASRGTQGSGTRRLSDAIRVRWGDAVQQLRKMCVEGRSIDMLVLDGLPKETLEYLRAAEPCLVPNAVIVADNAGARLHCLLQEDVPLRKGQGSAKLLYIAKVLH
jgi:Methyltransferase domain